MPVYDIDGVPVEFPYDAYDCQVAYMRAVVKALDGADNALLESPTGTGKTLCLLCATLGWRRHRRKAAEAVRTDWNASFANPENPTPAMACPRIWYSSRTHSQLKQVIHELKRTSYTTTHSVVLGSREHFCIHSSVGRMSGARQNACCKRVRDEDRCPPYAAHRKGFGKKVNTSLMDIEETVAACRSSNICPFYKNRDEAKEAELILLPYDYLINPRTRDALNVGLKNSVIIFDEGHNIEKSCESVASFELSNVDISNAITEVDDCLSIVEREPEDLKGVLEDLTFEQMMTLLNYLKGNLLDLESAICQERLEKDEFTGRNLLKKPGSYILEVFGRGGKYHAGMRKTDFKRISATIRKAVSILTFESQSISSGGLFLDKLESLMVTLFLPESSVLDRNYQTLIYQELPDESKRGTKRKSVDFWSKAATPVNDAPRVLCLWCFSSSVVMNELQRLEVRSVLITSGTLSPLGATAEAFGVPFPVMLENSHVINAQKQVWGSVLAAGPEGHKLDATFTHRSDPTYLTELGKSVVNFASCVPDGVLLAFQSYSMKDAVLRSWRQSGVWEAINEHKPIFEEPKGHAELQIMMEKYTHAITGAQKGTGIGGAMLAAVCRGKLCEGIDFTDRQCRMVIMIGIPYPAKNDLHVLAKQAFLDSRGTEGDGRRWYTREAVRAMNQTIGRVIRHKNDFGGILLCDERFGKDGRLTNMATALSSWLRPQISVPRPFENTMESCRAFFGTTPSLASAGMLGTPSQRLADASKVTAAAAKASGDAGGPEHDQQKLDAAKVATLSLSPSMALLASLWNKPDEAKARLAERKLSAATKRPGDGLAAVSPSQAARIPATPQQQQQQQQQQPGEPASAARPQPGVVTTTGSLEKPKASVEPVAVAAAASTARGFPGAAPASRSKAKAVAVVPLAMTRWFRDAERLVPLMEFDGLKEQLALVQAHGSIVAEGGAGAADSTEELQAALKNVADTLLPEFRFDSKEEELLRKQLVREVPAEFLPRLLARLWKPIVLAHQQEKGLDISCWS